MKKKKQSVWKKIFISAAAVLLLTAAVFFVYASDYYRADGAAVTAMNDDGAVSVLPLKNAYIFDGPGTDSALVFYPGAKVEFTSYAPLMKKLAENGMDCILVKMPFNMAFFGLNSADKYISEYKYDSWYIGGHSLGGAMAASYAAKNTDKLSGLLLLAAYPTSTLDADGFSVLSVYGSEDGVLNMEKLSAGEEYMPENYVSLCIDGGNHAYFGSYGEQKGDGTAEISRDEQFDITADAFLSFAGIK